MILESHYLETVRKTFLGQKRMAEKALAQINDDQCHVEPAPGSNSIAVIIQHLAGNMESRWSDFLTTDGEKPTRERDAEFEDGRFQRAALMQRWDNAWQLFEATLTSLTENDLLKTVMIRGEAHTVVQALERQIAHYGQHVGQIIYIAKLLKGMDFVSLTIPRGKSKEFLKQGPAL